MTKEFKWSDEYSVGIDEIDEQHKTLFTLINRLHQAIMHREGSAACVGILNELVDYTRIHFSLEQTLMRVGGYPEYEKHCGLHKALVDEVEALQQKIASGQAAISFELLQFLRNWLTRHILGEDMKYGMFFKQHGQLQQQNVDDWTEQSRDAMSKHKKKSSWWKFW
ncbi:MAG: bacteriohemerythrin [Zoogloeaceae bacterium]|jgi:hemerythrin|nr:bacteriohemerythrin [Zoogloeaceae bacterium]